MIKLFSWKKSLVLIAAGMGAVSYRTYQSYQQKGRLDSVDLWVAVVTIAIILCIVGFVGWWANKEE